MPERFIVAITRPLPGPFDVSGAEVRIGPERGFTSRAQLLEFVKGAHAFVSWVSERIDDEFLNGAGKQLKLVANFAVGYDNIDVAACAKRGVIVTNTPDAVTEGTADMAAALMLAAARRLSKADQFVRAGEWERYGMLGPSEFIGAPIAGKTLLIVGAGRIGFATAVRMLGWGMKTLYVARSQHPNFEFAPLNATRVELDDGLRQADFVSIHTPLTSETKHLINAQRLGLMKPTAVLVNTSRGAVVDGAALARALKDRKLFAAGLDVFENEPKVTAELRALDNVVLAPHIGSASTSSREAMTALCAANIRAVLAGRDPVTPVTVSLK